MFMASALALPSIPRERRGFQVLRMAPLSMWLLLRAKVFIAFPVVVATMLVFSIAVAFISKSGVAQLLELVILGLCLAAGFLSISVSGGPLDPPFGPTADRTAVRPVGGPASIAGPL